MNKKVEIIGGGLAGCEVALTLASEGVPCQLFEMRPQKSTPAHKTALLSELICSNSFKSDTPETSKGLLKEELRLLNSFIINAADYSKIPAGASLAVNRETFSSRITNMVEENPSIEIVRKEKDTVSDNTQTVIAAGPLASESICDSIRKITGADSLFFFDAISPIIDDDSIDKTKVFSASRYNKGPADFLNCPMTKEQFELFFLNLKNADRVTPKDFEPKHLFDGCMPIEEMADRGPKTMLFGPLKPVGLLNPETGERYEAVVQLRRENHEGSAWNMIGFQTRLKYQEQKRVFRLIPGLEKADFFQFGAMHRNTYLNSPEALMPDLSFKNNSNIFCAGQLSGAEGYAEAAATGKYCAFRILERLGKTVPEIPETTMTGSLIKSLTAPPPEMKNGFRPVNANFGIIPPLQVKERNKKLKKKMISKRALSSLKNSLSRLY